MTGGTQDQGGGSRKAGRFRLAKKADPQMAVYEGRRVLESLAGAFLYAVGVNLFIVPAGFYTGGIMGICQVIRTLLAEYLHLDLGGLDIAGILYYIANVPIFCIAYTQIGRKFFAKTLFTVTAQTVLLSLIPTAAVLDDRMAACMVGGILSGAGVGIVLRAGASSGGMDVIGMLLIRWKHDFSVGKVNMMVNAALYAVCLFLFDIQIVVYSVIYAAVHAVAMDRMHIQNINVEVHIITKANTILLEKEIFEELGRGITKWKTLGAYTYEKSHILYITMSKYEVHRLRAIVQKHDPQAFIVVNEGVTVLGHYLKKL